MKDNEGIPPEVQEMINAIGERVKQSREKMLMSQEQLAEDLGCSLRYVKRIERGDVHFRLNLLATLSYVLGVNLLKFLDMEFVKKLKTDREQNQD